MTNPFDKNKQGADKTAPEKAMDAVKENALASSPATAPEIKKADVKVDVKQEVKTIKVVTLVELPSYKGSRIPKGKHMSIPESAFDKALFAKIEDKK